MPVDFREDPEDRRQDSVRIAAGSPRRALTRRVLDIVYVLGILALAALIALIAKGVEKL